MTNRKTLSLANGQDGDGRIYLVPLVSALSVTALAEAVAAFELARQYRQQ